MSNLLNKIVENMEAIKEDIMKNKFSLMDQMINNPLKEAVI